MAIEGQAKITFELAPIFQQFAGGCRTIEMKADTVRAGLTRLAKLYPELGKWLYRADGEPAVLIMLHNEVVLPDRWNRALVDGDEISIPPLVYGG